MDEQQQQCPRCKQLSGYLVHAYWKPPDHPGFCLDCCEAANRKFDREGWPEPYEAPP